MWHADSRIIESQDDESNFPRSDRDNSGRKRKGVPMHPIELSALSLSKEDAVLMVRRAEMMVGRRGRGV